MPDQPPAMLSPETKAQIPVSTFISLLVSAVVLGGVWVTLREQVASAVADTLALYAEVRTLQMEDTVLRRELNQTREILIRIDENVKQLKQSVGRREQ